ncbi:4-hydroxy-tetrahydrodipicolinate reductase [Paracoccaceae bacterium]|nr:4-hydroxy-tetrahydrodipicolinate reductase [Paracoccaceae bacterium]
MKNHLKVCVLGASGRMGSQIIKRIMDIPNIDLHAVLEIEGHEWIGKDIGKKLQIKSSKIYLSDNLETGLKGADVVIDFTTPEYSLECLEACKKCKTAHIIGTTGFNLRQENKILEYVDTVTIVKAGNMSLGVNILTSLVEKVSSSLDLDFDIEILEMHHRNKIDAPSGTALMLGEAVAKGKRQKFSGLRTEAREGITGVRTPGKIGFAALRGGAIVGEHEVSFTSDTERISLKHEAFSRDIFVAGALKAASWAKGKKPGLYNMGNVLELDN